MPIIHGINMDKDDALGFMIYHLSLACNYFDAASDKISDHDEAITAFCTNDENKDAMKAFVNSLFCS